MHHSQVAEGYPRSNRGFSPCFHSIEVPREMHLFSTALQYHARAERGFGGDFTRGSRPLLKTLFKLHVRRKHGG